MKTSGFLACWVLMVVLALALIPGSAFGKHPCILIFQYDECLADGSVDLVVPTNSPVVCIGDSVTVSADVEITDSYYQTVMTYDKCDPDYADGSFSPSYEVTWTAKVGSWSTNGTGLTAAFTPTNCGLGSVSFGLTYTNGSPCNSSGTSGAGTSFTVKCDCFNSSYTTNNKEGSVTMTNLTMTPTNSCLGKSFSASADRSISNAVVKITTHHTNACGNVNTNYCPDTSVTNRPLPTIITNWWTVSGPGSYSTNGSGASAGPFTPTNGGSGTVTFFTKWRHAVDTNVTAITSTNLAFNVSTNCVQSTTETNCVDGSVTLANGIMSPVNGCPGGSFSAAVSQLINNAVVKFTTHYTNACGETTTNCPNTYVTNYPAPTVLSSGWTISGPGGYSSSGSGLSTSTFSPPGCGSGTVTFNLTYKNDSPCDTAVHSAAPVSLGFTVSCACIAASYVTNCLANGNVSLGSATISPPNGCLGTSFSASASQTISNATAVTTTRYTNACGQTTANCPDTYVTNPVSTVVSNWWVATVGSWSTNGSGLSATFMPPNLGSGTVTFNATYKNTTPCDTNVHSAAPVNVGFGVQSVGLTLSKQTVFVNADDDNHNGTNDVSEPLTGSQISGENDLIQLNLALQNVSGSQSVTLSVSASIGRIRVWPNATRGPGAPLLDNSDPGKLTTNWLASAAPTSLYIEGVSASASVDDVALNVGTTTGCTMSTNLTVIGLSSVVFQTNTSPLFANAGVGGGRAIYPDKPTPGSGGDYSLVKVVATIAPAMPGISLYLKSFDVDDPSSTNAPLDDEAAGPDNKATSNKAGRLGGGSDTITLVTDTNGVARTDFNVTLQPGDNFRVVASPLSDFPNHCVALQATNNGAVVFLNSTVEIPSNYQTELLTVWRRLHVEVDSMSAVINNRVTGNVSAIRGNSSGATNVVLSVNLKTQLTPADSSTNLSSPSPANGRFENGSITIGTSTSTGLLGNGDNFVWMPAGGTFNIPFTVKDANGSNAVSGQVLAMSLSSFFYFTINTTLATNAYAGGTLTVAGSAYGVMQNVGNSVRAFPGAAIPFTLHDDDNDALLPQLPDTGLMVQKFAPAYVVPLIDGGGNFNNIKQSIAFSANVDSTTHTSVNAELNKTGAFESEGNRSSDYWIAYIITTYQVEPAKDYDPDGTGEWGPQGVNGGGASFRRGALLFRESLRDYSRQMSVSSAGMSDLERRAVVHEIGHQFGCADQTGGIYDYSLEYDLSADPVFLPLHLNIIRSIPSPGQ
jgi:hypothetical protein